MIKTIAIALLAVIQLFTTEGTAPEGTLAAVEAKCSELDSDSNITAVGAENVSY